MAEMPKMKKVISEGLKAGMARPAARMTDTIGHGPPSGMIMFGAPTVIIGGQIAARMGDPIKCEIHGPGGNVTMGSVTVIIAGACAARMGDPTACCVPGKAGTGAPGTVGTPGSFSDEYEGNGPDHKKSGYENEDGVQRQDEFRLWGDKQTLFDSWGFKNEVETTLVTGKSEGHRDKHWNNTGGSAQGSLGTRKSTTTLPDGTQITHTTGMGNAAAGRDYMLGTDGRRTGLNIGDSGQASIVDETWEHKDEIPLPFGYSLQRTSVLGGSVGGGGVAYNAGAYHDAADGRYHLNLLGDGAFAFGVKFGLDFSIGKQAAPGGGGTPGAGAVGLAGAITSGCMNVLIGG